MKAIKTESGKWTCDLCGGEYDTEAEANECCSEEQTEEDDD